MKNSLKNSLKMAALVLALGSASSVGYAHNNDSTGKPKAAAPVSTEQHPFGKQGNPKKASRTVAINMNDLMRFGPADITVRQGETIRFVVRNQGKMLHEMVIGTLDELKAHGELMKKHPGMEHDEPWMVHVDPGKKAEMVWQFTRAGEFYYACLIPGHFEAGMVGKIKVVKE